jgi:hypothetical protein
MQRCAVPQACRTIHPKEIDLADNSKKLNAAEIQFKKTQQAIEGKQAMAQYEADAVATRKKTERLKALRLARDAEEAAAAPPVATKKKKTAKKAKPSKVRSASLSEWWKDQKEDGRTG